MKISNYSMKIWSKFNVGKKLFCFDKKKSSFCENFGSQIKFCATPSAYVIYEWYLVPPVLIQGNFLQDFVFGGGDMIHM